MLMKMKINVVWNWSAINYVRFACVFLLYNWGENKTIKLFAAFLIELIDVRSRMLAIMQM